MSSNISSADIDLACVQARIAAEELLRSPWDWVLGQNKELIEACENEGVANAITDVLRAMEIWAHDRGLMIKDVIIASWNWTAQGALVVEFARGNIS